MGCVCVTGWPGLTGLSYGRGIELWQIPFLTGLPWLITVLEQPVISLWNSLPWDVWVASGL